MKVHVEAKPLHEPLAGGTPGAHGHGRAARRRPRHLVALDDGKPGRALPDPEAAAGADQRQAGGEVPCPAFLIRHPSAGAILVDTGLHPSIATDAGRELRRPRRPASASPSLEPGEDVPAQLRKRGLDPGEVPIVVMTHLHLDHASAISEFPRRRPSSSARPSGRRRRAARSRSLNGYRRPHYDYAFDYRTVDFDRSDDRLLRQLRPHLRPLRRRLDPPRLHPRALAPATCRSSPASRSATS